MISSDGTEETVSLFLESIHSRFPDINPEYFMTDKDYAQINSIGRVHPSAEILLCWWHVLHAWQQHISITAYPEVWRLMKTWVRITDASEFSERWASIKAIAPASVIEYLEKNWMPITKMWSAVYRTERTIFQDCDTNMLVEAWHHLLKGKFMQGKRNRRLDHLVYILIKQTIPHFIHRHRAQEHGFEGPDLEAQERLRIESLAKLITTADIHQSDVEASMFTVKSQTNRNKTYTVDIDAYDCTCPSFPKVLLCKHIYAVQLHFPELCQPVPCSTLDISPADTFEVNGPITQPSPKESPSDLDSDTTNSRLIAETISSLSSLVCRLKDTQKLPLDPAELKSLKETVDGMLVASLAEDDILPRPVRIAPNQHTWSETGMTMGQVKGKRKTTHTDPYGGGERSGKKARPDALQVTSAPLQSMPAQPINTVNQPPSSTTADVVFDPATFDLRDHDALHKLKRPQLNKLCARYGVSAGNRNADIIARLQALIPSQHIST
ncbi:hypothetical protein D9611_002793 [Ephemerocybe angulata]|nr:hypothetical protein D9611_002793 [Tulosesus angulatus]